MTYVKTHKIYLQSTLQFTIKKTTTTDLQHFCLVDGSIGKISTKKQQQVTT